MSDKIRDTKGKIQNTMYHRRIKIFAILLTFFLFAFLLRLAQMQLLSGSFYRDKLTKLRLQKSHSRQFKTVRGKILDRNGKVLAVDEPQFQLYINYGLTCFMDDRVREGNLLKAADKKDNTGASAAKAQKEMDDGLADLNQIIIKCAQLGGVKPTEVKTEIQKINDFIWKRRTFQAWRDNFSNSEVFENYKNIISIPDYVATADFEKKEANPVERLRLINKVDIAEMHKSWPLVELKTDDDIFTAQLEFSDIDGVQILAKGQRFYPFGPAAAQTIGWVGPATQQADRQLFADDKLSRYLDDEVCGREDGVEYACETILRGKRGKIVYDIDRELIDETKAQLGKDVSLTLDIELQQKTEEYLTDCKGNPNCRAPMAAVVIEVASGDILALVSIPVFDLNRIRFNYAGIANDPNEPLRNRAINKQYPPGSAIKPLILIAGLESGKITADEIIHCPAQKAPRGWPSCWLYNKYHWTGHDDMWQNNARNAIKGSCNIYFSQLADRIEPLVLQQWLSAFGYGHVSSLVARDPSRLGVEPRQDSSLELQDTGQETRELRQAPGQISTIPAQSTNPTFEQLPPLNRSERRYFGIGQGNLRATPLQAANAMAAIARGGVYDIDHELIDETKAQLGKDVSLTLDIELQQRIEGYLTDCKGNPNCRAPTAAVVIEVASGDILALVSEPIFDLNRIRGDYASVANDPNEPLRNRAINKQYPPGSAIKPLILIAGLESGKITADEIIHCPAQKAPRGWPNCWLYNKYHWTGHDDMWQNNARNAIKGSCNIYFSQLADRIEPLVLQQWLLAFGYGHVSSLVARDSSLVQAGDGDEARDLRQAPGQISTIPAISSFEQLPPLNRSERRYFGIGQGNLRATPLQAANAMAAIAREGIYKPPRLFLTPDVTRGEKDLGISEQTLSVVRDGMYAVVNEPGGTAYKEFAAAGLAEQGVKVYGKTGSTEEPANAWFSGFAEDSKGRKLAIAVVVEGGQHGSSDAAPLARDIIQFCIEAGYIGRILH